MPMSFRSLRLSFLGLMVASISVVAGAVSVNAQAATITKTVDGKDYEFTTIYGAYSDASIASQLESMPWWGDSTLSWSVSEAILNDLGDSGPAQPAASALAAYGTSGGNVSITYTLTGTSTVVDCPSSCPSLALVHYYIIGTLLTSSNFAPAKYTLAPDLIPSNVPTCSGSEFVSGFQILGGGKISWYVDHRHKDKCFDVDVNVLPEGVSS